jgi:hypothetical protein
MPAEAVSLALAASIYPPALAAVIALGRGREVRLRVAIFVLSAYATVLCTGALMLFLFVEVQATHRQLVTPTASLYLAAGCVLLLVAVRLSRPRGEPSRPSAGASRTDRYLQSRRLVLALGVVLYVVPSPIFVGAVKAIADTHAGTTQQLVYLVEILLIMLWLIEVPMLMLIAFPVRAQSALERINGWFAAHGREILVLGSAGLGLYLLGVGALELAAR